VIDMTNARAGDFDEPMEEGEDDPGFAGGGGPAAAMDEAEETLDEHGDNLATTDEEDD
jgi:hypothetical protein